jgi:hypothetical protein
MMKSNNLESAKRLGRKTFLVIAGLLVSLSITSLVAAGLASGPYSKMSMLYEKTFLNVDVLTLTVVVDTDTQTKIAKKASGKNADNAPIGDIASVIKDAKQARVTLKFERDVPFDRWKDEVVNNLGEAQKAGWITADTKSKVTSGLPQWFAKIQDRGYEEDDVLTYEVSPAGLRTTVKSKGGQVLVDRTDKNQTIAGVVLRSYFAPGSAFRKPLIKSLFK